MKKHKPNETPQATSKQPQLHTTHTPPPKETNVHPTIDVKDIHKFVAYLFQVASNPEEM